MSRYKHISGRRRGTSNSFLNIRKRATFEEKKKLGYLINILNYTGCLFSDDLFEITLKYLNTSKKRILYKQVISYAKRVRINIESYHNNTEQLNESLKDLFCNDRLKHQFYRFMSSYLNEIYKHTKWDESKINQKLMNIKKLFKLSETEIEVLTLSYLYNKDCMFEKLADELCMYVDVKTNFRSLSTSKKLLHIITRQNTSDIDKAINNGSALLKSGLLDKDMDVPHEVKSFLDGSSNKPINQNYFSEFSGDAVPLEYHTVEKQHVETIKTLKAHKPAHLGINVLLYGMPGTGKTEFARSLGKHLGLNIFEIKNIDADEQSDEKSLSLFRYRALTACQRMIDTKKSLIIVDEADSVLNSEPEFFAFSPVAEKGQINKLLDDSVAFIIWITNRYHGIDDSTKRRFDYSIGFDKLSFEQRKVIWQMSIRKHRLARCFSDADIDTLASDYEISAGGIDIALRSASRVYRKNRSRKGIMGIVENIIKAHVKILDQKQDKNIKKAGSPEYSLDGLHIKSDVNATVLIIDRFNKQWSQTNENSEVRNMNLLLYGPPGTGKTEFAKYIARRTNRRLIIKRASDLLSCYVGETEKLIRNAFEEAEKDKAILFIDEADSFLGTREHAAHSWEISFVNEFLTNMETFRGMLICATNFKYIVDSAAIRRFNIKLEFDYLKPEGAITFYKMFMGRLIKKPLSQPEASEIGSIGYLTPGDFKVVYQRYSFYNNNEISHSQLIDALKQEVASKSGNLGKKMGFI